MNGPLDGVPPEAYRAAAQAMLWDALDPQTTEQSRTAAWLMGWPTETLQNITAMIVQAR